MDMKEKLLAEMEQSDFAKNNGKIMRTLNVLAPSYHNLSSIQRILKDDGIGEGQYAACLDFLALEGYILLRTVKDHVRCEDPRSLLRGVHNGHLCPQHGRTQTARNG